MFSSNMEKDSSEEPIPCIDLCETDDEPDRESIIPENLTSENNDEAPVLAHDQNSSDSDDSDPEELDFELQSLLPSTEPEFLDFEKADNEDELIIPLETEVGVSKGATGEMRCHICNTTFRSKIRYLIHARRHFAIDHFVCPACKKGFTTLIRCQAHELNEHQIKETETSNEAKDKNRDTSSYAFRTRNARKCNNYNSSEAAEALEEGNEIEVVPSTCLYPYRGPEIRKPYEQYRVELEFGRQRKTNSRVQAKFTIETQRKNKRELNAIEKREEEAKKLKQSQQLVLVSQSPLLSSTLLNPTTPSRIPARRRPVLLNNLGDDATVKGYFCSLCGKLSATENKIIKHGEKHHPGVPDREFLQVLRCVSRCSSDAESGDQELFKQSKSTKTNPPQPSQSSLKYLARKQRQEEIERLKDAKLFRKRSHIYRPWEKPDKYDLTPTKDEFLFAMKLIPRNDVVLGPRISLNNITSSILRRRERDVSPFPGFRRSARIHLEKLPYSVHKKYYVCGYGECELFADSKSEVREHRRSVHFRSLRQAKTMDYGESHLQLAILNSSESQSSSSSVPIPKTQINFYPLTCIHCKLKVPNTCELRLHDEIHRNPMVIKVAKLSQDLFANAKITLSLDDMFSLEANNIPNGVHHVPGSEVNYADQPQKRLRVK